MAGQPGRSGGARVGAGRKPKNKAQDEPKENQIIDPDSPLTDGKDRDPLEFLLMVQNNPLADPRLRVRAAIAAAQYKHVKRADGGKKEEQEGEAKKAGQGRFAPRAAPSLKVVNK